MYCYLVEEKSVKQIHKETKTKYDEDGMFCPSMAPTLKSLGAQKKVHAKLQMQLILFSIQFGGMGKCQGQNQNNFNQSQGQSQVWGREISNLHTGYTTNKSTNF